MYLLLLLFSPNKHSRSAHSVWRLSSQAHAAIAIFTWNFRSASLPKTSCTISGECFFLLRRISTLFAGFFYLCCKCAKQALNFCTQTENFAQILVLSGSHTTKTQPEIRTIPKHTKIAHPFPCRWTISANSVYISIFPMCIGKKTLNLCGKQHKKEFRTAL